MPNLRLDQYFTPSDVAFRLASIIQPFSPLSVVDSNCGHGELLSACQSVLSCKTFSGIDIDEKVINALSSSKPSWKLKNGDALTSLAWSSFENSNFCAAVLNPPFSFQRKRADKATISASKLSASPALSHVLAAINYGHPKVIAAILPESCATSDIDRHARLKINSEYEVQIIERLSPNTFPGATANAFIARMVRRNQPEAQTTFGSILQIPKNVEVVRGGLPVHLKVLDPIAGLPFIHSTHLRKLSTTALKNLEKVQPISRGVITGNFVLFPRVGVPALNTLEAVSFEQPVQLSDCVMGVRCISYEHAQQVSDLLKLNHADFCMLYHGTGARYTTVASVERWLVNFPQI